MKSLQILVVVAAVLASSASLISAQKVAWKNSFSTAAAMMYSTPALSRHSAFFGAGKQLHSVNRQTGAANWTANAAASIFSTPSVHSNSDSVFFGDNAGWLYSVSMAKGTAKWSYNISEPITASPAVYQKGGVVVVGSYDARIWAVSMTTGKPVWNVSTGSFVSGSAVISADGFAIVPSQDGFIRALDCSLLGAEVWKFDAKDPVSEGCAINSAATVVYCSSKKGTLFALNATTGKQIWVHHLAGGVGASAAVTLSPDGKFLYFPANFNVLMCHETSTGHPMWGYTNPDARLQSQAGVSPDGSLVFFGTNNIAKTDVVAVDAKSGAEKWKFSNAGTGAVTTGISVSAAGNHLYFGASSGDLFCLSP